MNTAIKGLIESLPSLELTKTSKELFLEFIRTRYPHMKITFPRTNEVHLHIKHRWKDPECIILCNRIAMHNKHNKFNFILKLHCLG